MAVSFTSCSCTTTLPPSLTPPRVYSPFNPIADNKRGQKQQQRDQSPITTFAAKSGGFSLDSIIKKCQTCGGQGAVDCAGCKGTGKNKKNGNIFERWKCYDCQGFGLKSCPTCGQGRGLTPEQRGER